jgi:hypothetical protein
MGMNAVRNLKVWAALLMAAVAASVLMAVVLAAPAQAAPFSVTNTADSGAGSLRQAISDANASAGEDTINFAPSLSGQTITLGSQLAVADSAGLTIDGGSANITVSGDNKYRVLDVRSGAKLTLNNLTVANGRINFGGGIFNNGTLTVTNSTLSGNNANEDFGSGGGGGIWNAASGTATVSNSTLSGNSAQIAGGGIFNQGGTLTVSNSTLSGNSANNGGSLSSNGGSVTLKNTIVANNDQVRGWDCSGTITDGGYNLDSGTSCGFGTANNSLSG